MADTKEVKAPDVGGDEVEVIEILVSKGDKLEAEDALITVESDKASMDIPAPFGGTIAEMKVSVGDKIKEGDLLALMEAAGDDSEDNAEEESADSSDEKSDDSSDDSDSDKKSEEPQEDTSKDEKKEKKKSSGGSKVIEVTVPDIGESGEVEIIEVLVSKGDEISAEDGLITLETDKATMDVPSPQAGTVESVEVSVGDKVKEGSLVLKLKVSDDSGAEDEADDDSDSKQAESEASQSQDSKDDKDDKDSKDQQGSKSDGDRKPPVPDHPLDKKGRLKA